MKDAMSTPDDEYDVEVGETVDAVSSDVMGFVTEGADVRLV
jgi:hypothetical protein